MTNVVEIEVQNEVAILCFNRADALNALTVELAEAIAANLIELDGRDDVLGIVLTGAGDRAFCAGVDLKEARAVQVADIEQWFGTVCNIYKQILQTDKPVIAAFNGPAVGVGLTLTLSADVRIAAPNIKMGLVFSARGIIAEGASSWFLPRLVGMSRALEWAMSARIFRSEEALEAGLIRSIHELDDLLPAAHKLAREFAANSRVSNAVIRQMFWRMQGAEDPIIAHRLDTKGMVQRGASADATEGTTAFLEKRAAKFPDKVSQDMPDFFPWWEEPKFLE